MNSLKTSPVQMDLKPEKLNDVQQGNYNYVKKYIDVNKKSHRWFGITGQYLPIQFYLFYLFFCLGVVKNKAFIFTYLSLYFLQLCCMQSIRGIR